MENAELLQNSKREKGKSILRENRQENVWLNTDKQMPYDCWIATQLDVMFPFWPGQNSAPPSLRTLLEKPRKLPYRMSPAKVTIDNMQSSEFSAWL